MPRADVIQPVRAAVRAAVLAVCLVAVPCGCSSYAAPQIRVASVAVSDRSDEAIVLDFTLDAHNSNQVALPLKTIRYTVRIDGVVAARGTRSGEATLRRVGKQQVVLPAAIPFRDGVRVRTGSRYEISGRLTYVTPGELAQRLFDAGVRRPSASFRDSGVLDLGPSAAGASTPSAPADDRPTTP